MTNNLKKNNYTAVLGSKSRPGLDLDCISKMWKIIDGFIMEYN